MSNVLVAVETFNPAMIASLSNMNPWIGEANKYFDDFPKKEPKNLGDTINLRLPTRMSAQAGLVVTNNVPVIQRPLPLTINQSANVSYGFTNQERVFNLSQEDFMQEFGTAAAEELGDQIGAYVSTMAILKTYRFYGDGVTPFTSYQQYAQMLANFRNFGAPPGEIKCFIDDLSNPAVVGSGLNQFVPRRNEEIANSWSIGNFNGADFFTTNILAIQYAGVIGNEGIILTITDISDDGTQLTLSGAPHSESQAVKSGDLFTLDYNGAAGLKYLTFRGHLVSGQKVQVRATADAASDGSGNITISIDPPLIYDATGLDPNRNINLDIATTSGILVKGVPSHRAGLVNAGNTLFLGMPRLEEEIPYPTAVEFDPDSKCSLRTYYGSKFQQNFKGITHDCIYDATSQGEYNMRVIYTL